MNRFFSMKRFGAYCRKQCSENRKMYLFGAIFIVLAVVFCFGLFIRRIDESYFTLDPNRALVGTLLVWALSTFACFWRWNSRELADLSRNIIYLTTPASSFEKYGFVWFNSLGLSLFVLLVFWAVYGLADLVVVYSKPIYFTTILSALLFLLLFGHALSLFLLVLFRRNGLLAGIVVLGVFLFLFGFVYEWLKSSGVLGESFMRTTDPFFIVFHVRTSGMNHVVSWIPTGLRQCLDTAAILILAVTFWTAGYFRFKERQLN